MTRSTRRTIPGPERVRGRSAHLPRTFVLAVLALGAWSHAPARGDADAPAVVAVHVDAAEAEQALDLVELAGRGEAIPGNLWQDLFETDGYRRLKVREASMQRDFTDEEFRAFLLEPGLAERAPALRATLARWSTADLSTATARALAYLPPDATIRATIYPMVKPKPNSFVFDLANDPAIFLYLDPEVSDTRFLNTAAHELHHIGFGTACPRPAVEAEIEGLDEGVRRALRWQGAFGEGFAMLAAAGGVDAHPHAASPTADRERWDRDVDRVADDTATLDGFFLDLLDGSLTEAQEIERARSFYGIQGPWYTVGWRIAETIERELGREALVEAFCDPRRLLATHRGALAKRGESAWSDRLVERLSGSDAAD